MISDRPEPIGDVLRRVFRGEDGRRALGWLNAKTLAQLPQPPASGIEAAWRQGRAALYLELTTALENEHGRADSNPADGNHDAAQHSGFGW